MKLKSITLATLTALYAAGVGATLTTLNATGNQDDMQLKQFIPQQSERPPRLGETSAKNIKVKQNGGVNVQLNYAQSASKFTPEEGVSGPQVYIVELHGNTVQSEYQQQLAAHAFDDLQPTALKGHALKSPQLAAIELQINQRQEQILLEAASTLGRELTPARRFSKAINGFVTEMTPQEAQRLAHLDNVKKITRRQMLQLQTDIGPDIIDAPNVWQGGTVSASPYKGEGIIMGIIDTGINTDHPSFASTGDDGYQVSNPFGSGNYVGDCALSDYAERCNDKLIGVFSYDVITDQYSAAEYQDPNHSPFETPVEIRPRFGEDYNGHGSHTAATAAGNVMYDVPYVQPHGAQSDGLETGFTFERVSGVAPHANVVAFQVCYSGVGKWVGCPSDALVAAIEDAIDVGVDVINFSIGSALGSNPWTSPTQQAFLNAHEAGIAIAAAAGNSGSDGVREIRGYIDNTSPWLLTVAASTTGRTMTVSDKYLTSFSGGDTTAPTDILGASISGEITGNLVLAADYGDELCAEPFAPGTFNADDIVVCQRGEIARVAKADNVQSGGGGGMVLYNTSYSSSAPEGQLFNDSYSIPGIHISANDWFNKLQPWLASGSNHMATITASEVIRNVDESQQDMLADFSSRGPSTHNPEHLVPSVTAPGVAIYAANADDQPFTPFPQASDWMIMSGTSMASPHTAGALALVKQAHPDWTVAQIHSALQMTAERTVKGRTSSWAPYEEVGTYRAGSGRINVSNAINSGLIMNETVANFAASNPDNGGMPTRLNLPELVNLNCSSPCTWVREVTAIQDGTWNVGTSTSEYSVKLTATPSSFTLKKGETRAIAITAEILDAQAGSGNAEQEVMGEVTLTATNPAIPQIYWPAVFKYDGGHLPDNINVSMHRDSGNYLIKNMNLPQLEDGSYVATKAVKANKQVVTLAQNETNASNFGRLRQVQEDDLLFTLDVPENAARLIVETLARTDSSVDTLITPLLAGDLDVYVGIDLNNNGQPDWDSEAICASTSDVKMDYCNIDNPQAGTYWVVLDNYRNNFHAGDHWDTFEYASAVVMKEASANVTVSGPSQHTGLEPADVNIHYDFPDAVSGDIYYGAILFGTDQENIGNIDTVATKYVRGDNEFSIRASQTSALAGEQVTINTHVMQNNLGYDRAYSIDVAIPDHLQLVPGSITLSRSDVGEIVETEHGFTLTGAQQDSRDWAPDYQVTTSDNDPLCSVPNYGQGEGNYVNLRDFGFAPSFGGGYRDVQEIDLRQVFGSDATVSTYNNFAYEQTPIVRVNPVGYLQFDDLPDFFGFTQPYPYFGFPHIQIGALHRGAAMTDAGIDWSRQYVPYNPDMNADTENAGITVAFAGTSLLVEWDNARRSEEVWDSELGQRVRIDGDDRVDFEILYDLEYGFDQGDYEIIMAYNNIDLNGNEHGAIGIQGFIGPRDPYGPVYGYLGKTYAYHDLASKVKDNFAVCWDYVGPESTQFDISYEVLTKLDAAGHEQNIVTTITTDDDAPQVLELSLNVPSNLKIGHIGDQTIAEDSELSGLLVAVADTNKVPNVITVSGEHISASVNHTASGGEINLVPDANFSGSTEVTVTVTDSRNPGDQVSTSFMLHVTPEQDAPIASAVAVTVSEGQSATLDASASFDPDGDELSYVWSGPGQIDSPTKMTTSVSGLEVGTHQFTVVVSDATASATAEMMVTVTAKDDSKSGSGSLSWMLIALLSLGLVRRRQSI
ncbi:S8 family serine peptidase [Pseudoalteromonas sp. T1lg88]|uniref:S8 family serine peptidase n=1 Tax=Pseudoalteromonas sp. T1lg88 TaxID=2077104 RepID=UPI000CF6850A|nr:S8 family serine peptidase [Pseudoalteromonas sp. T1lg88]